MISIKFPRDQWVNEIVPWDDTDPFILHSQYYICQGFGDVRSQVTCGNDIINYDIIKWKQFPRYYPFVRGIHWPPVDFPYKGTVTQTFDVSLLLIWKTNCWTNIQLTDIRDAMTVVWRRRNAYSSWSLPVIPPKGLTVKIKGGIRENKLTLYKTFLTVDATYIS